MEAVSLIFGTLLAGAMLAGLTYLINRSRVTPEQAVQLGYTEDEQRALMKERLLFARRKYVICGPRSYDPDDLAQARAVYPEIKRMQAETDARIRQMAQETAARIEESNRRLRAWMNAQQEELERQRAAHAELLRSMRIRLQVIPPEVAQALAVLGLAPDAAFDEVRSRYRQLAKRHHPDAGGDPQQFIRLTDAYSRVIAWIETGS